MRARSYLSPKLFRVVQIFVLVGLVALLVHAVDWGDAVALLQRAEPVWLIAAALVLTLQTLLSAQRWRVTAAQLGLLIPLGDAIREYYLSQVVNQSLPGGVIGDAGRAVRARGQSGLLISGQAVVFERLAGQIGLLTVLVVGFGLSFVIPVGFDWPNWLIIPLVTTLIVLACVPIALALGLRIFGRSDHALRRFVAAFIRAVAGRGVIVQQAGLSLGTAICNVLAFAFCAAAIGIDLPILVVATLVPLILFAMVLPFSISGWGLREGAAALLFPVIGATSGEGLAASVAFGLVFLLTVLPGMVVTWFRPNFFAVGER